MYEVITGCALFLGVGLTFEILHKIFSSFPERSDPEGVVPSKVFKQISFNRDKAKSDSCVICLEAFKTEELVAFLSCNHLYHFWCIDDWFQKNQTCPICRRQD